MWSGLLTGIATAVVQALVEASVALGLNARFGRVSSEARRAAEEALNSTTTFNVHDLGARLTPEQATALLSFVESPQFAHFVLHAAVSDFLGKPKDRQEILRSQVSHSLRHTGQFLGTDLVQGTDFVLAAISVALSSIGLAAQHADRRLGALAIATDLASAGVRNSDLLAQLKDIRDIEEFIDGYQRAVAQRHSRIRVSHVGRTLTADHAALYVEPHLRPSSSVGWLDADHHVAAEMGSTAATVADLVASRQRVVILGDPGAGKSTFAANLVHCIASGTFELEGLVPFLLIVRDHTRRLREDHELFIQYLEATCRQQYQIEPPPTAIEYLLLNGRAVIVVDGLDELGDARHRERFANAVEAFSHRYPAARVVVTSRIVGYHEVPLDLARFPTAEIAPFNTAQVRRYVSAFFSLDDSIGALRHADFVESFMRESDTADDLRRNPLLLSLLCILYTSLNFIPRHKPELYERCAELLFELWDRSRGIEVGHRYGADIKPAVQRLAFKLLTDPNGRQSIPRTELLTDLTTYLRTKRYDDDDDAAQAAADFLDFCTGRAWVLTDVGSDRHEPSYGFVHRTFLEYFAAGQLVKNDPHPAAVWAQLMARINDGGWQVACLLSIQILDRSVDDGADQLLSLAMEQSQECWNTSRPASSRLLEFCVRALEAVAPSNAVLRNLVSAAVRLACDTPAQTRREPISTGRQPETDLPMQLLLRLCVSDTRLARAIADAVHHCMYELPAESSATMVFAKLQDVFPAGQYLRCEQTFLPQVNLWSRLLDMPSAEDVTELGVEVLFMATTMLGENIPPPVCLLLPTNYVGAPIPNIDEQLIAALETLAPSVIKGFQGVGRLRSGYPERTMIRNSGLTREWLMALSPAARSTALLLALVAFETGLCDVPENDPLAGLFVRRSHTEVLDSLGISPQAKQHAIDWLKNSAMA